MAAPEPRNPFYALLMVCCVVFVITALAEFQLATEDKAHETGSGVPPSPFRALLRGEGWRFLLVELAGILLFGILSMGLDRLRRLRKEREQRAIPPRKEPS